MIDAAVMSLSGACLGSGALLDAWGAWKDRDGARRRGFGLLVAGWAGLLGLVAWLWISMGRPPIRTLGETRLLYAAWLPAIALFAALRWGTRALLAPMALLALVFLGLDLALPEARTKALMPALQSGWFVPHVVVYMAAYATLALASLAAAAVLAAERLGRPLDAAGRALPGRLLWLGFPLLTCGLVIGAVWAKGAWGHYWTWDPKETWAFLTWAFYLVPLHLRARKGSDRLLWWALLGFPVVLLCWFGVNALPTAGQSLHSYTS